MSEQESSATINNYITQTLYQPVLVLDDIITSEIDIEALFVVRGTYSGTEALTNLKLKVKPESLSETIDINEHTRFVVGGHDEFLALKEKRKDVHEVIYDEDFDQLVVQESSTGADFTKLKQCMLNKYNLHEIEVKYDRPVTIIFSDYGIGKTSFLQRARDQINNIYPEAKTMFLTGYNLNEFYINFKVRNAKNFEFFFEIDVTISNIYLFIDNFENMRDYMDIIKILQDFHLNYKNIKIWMTCTKDITKNELESKFGTFASYLSPLTQELQTQYLKQMWNIKNDEFDSYIDEILRLSNRNYWKKFLKTPSYLVLNLDFTSYPLHLKMIGAKFKHFDKSTPNDVNILDIYEHFIEQNYKIDNLDELAALTLSEKVNILPTLECNGILNFLAAKWFAKNVKLFRQEIRQLFLSDSLNWQFGYFFNRLICRESKLFSAILNRDFDPVDSIISTLDNVLPSLTDLGGRTVLHLSEDIFISELLIENGARFDVKDDIFNWSAVRAMEHYNNLTILDLFLRHNADVTDLHVTHKLKEEELSKRFKYAIDQRLVGYVKYVCEFCANLKVSPKDVYEAVYKLPEDGIVPILKRVKNTNAYVGFCDQTPLFTAVERNYFDAVKYMIHNLKYNIHHRSTGNNCTLLHVAAENGLIEMAEYLLESGLDINITDDQNTNAVITCCRSNQLAMLEFLITKGIKTDICLSNGQTPLQVACNIGSPDVAKYLFENAANLNIKCDESLETCIYNAVKGSNLELVEFLLAQGPVDINFKQDGENILHMACKESYFQIIKLIVQKGGDVNATNNNGSTPLFELYFSDGDTALKYLFENGANLQHLNNNGENALHKYASVMAETYYEMLDQILMIEFLIDNGLDINLKSSNGNTALHIACINNTEEIVTVLLDRGADINAVNDSGNCPIQEANNLSRTQIVEYLISKGADTNLLNK